MPTSSRGATTTSSVIADDVCFEDAAKLISTADMRREAAADGARATVCLSPEEKPNHISRAV